MSGEARNDEIEVLRAVAILLVVFSHLGILLSWQHFALLAWIYERFTFWVGVDLFFCISGFVIARSLIPKLDGLKGAQFWEEVVAFWIRRWYRIIPSAWAWLTIVLLLTLFFNQSYFLGHFQRNAIEALSAVLNIANFYYYECVRVDPTRCGGPLGIYWSLSLEEQFYFALPILVAFARKWLAALCLLLVLLQLFVERHPWSSLLWFIRTDAIFLGVMLAIVYRSKIFAVFEPSVLRHRLPRWMVFALLCCALGAVPAHGMVPFGVGFVALVSVALVFVASHGKGYLMADGYLRRALVWIGLRSYAIYLLHEPVFWLTREAWGRMYPQGVPINEVLIFTFHAVGLALVFAVSELNYRLLETPLRRRGRDIASEYLANAANRRTST